MGKIPGNNLAAAINFFLPYKKKIFYLFALGFLSSGIFLTGPYLSKLFIDKALLNKDVSAFIKLGVIGSAVFLASTVFKMLEDITKNRISIKVKLSLSQKFVRKFYSLDLSFLQSKSCGENIYRICDIDSACRLALEHIPLVLADICKLIVVLAIAFFIDARMAVLLVILSPLFLAKSYYLKNKLKDVYNEIWESNARIIKKIQETFSRILLVKAYRLERYEWLRYAKLLIDSIRYQIKSFRWSVINSLVSTFLSKAIYGAISLYGGWLIIKGEISLGSYTAAIVYIAQAGSLLQSIAANYEYIVLESVSLDKFLEIMDITPKIKDAPGSREIGPFKKEILFKCVSFGYDAGRQVFKNLNLKIMLLPQIAFIGPSGCGKTTLINLILRLYEPCMGEIFIDGMNLKDARLESLASHIAIAAQQPFLFDAPVRENLSYGLGAISQDEIEEACKIACVDSYMEGLPEGYDTFLGEDAFCLSQGLKQRVALARAIVRKPLLLILDEALSSVDSFTEARILRNLRLNRQGKYTIIISHRLSTIQDSDRIYFLNPCGLIEEGSHNELLKFSGAYGAFFKGQLEGLREAAVI